MTKEQANENNIDTATDALVRAPGNAEIDAQAANEPNVSYRHSGARFVPADPDRAEELAKLNYETWREVVNNEGVSQIPSNFYDDWSDTFKNMTNDQLVSSIRTLAENIEDPNVVSSSKKQEMVHAQTLMIVEALRNRYTIEKALLGATPLNFASQEELDAKYFGHLQKLRHRYYHPEIFEGGPLQAMDEITLKTKINYDAHIQNRLAMLNPMIKIHETKLRTINAIAKDKGPQFESYEELNEAMQNAAFDPASLASIYGNEDAFAMA